MITNDAAKGFKRLGEKIMQLTSGGIMPVTYLLNQKTKEIALISPIEKKSLLVLCSP